jgi:hypothetical protein
MDKNLKNQDKISADITVTKEYAEKSSHEEFVDYSKV